MAATMSAVCPACGKYHTFYINEDFFTAFGRYEYSCPADDSVTCIDAGPDLNSANVKTIPRDAVFVRQVRRV